MTDGGGPAVVVVIDDDYAMRLSCRKILEKAGHKAEVFENGAQALEAVARLRPSMALVDLKMPGISGTEVVSRIHEIDPNITIAVITGYATIDTAVEAMKSGAYDFLPKPFSPDELRIIVNRGLERHRLALEAQRSEVERALLKRRFITFVSHQMQSPLAAIRQYLDVLNQLEGTPEADSRRKEWLERCLKRTEEMQALIRDWLTLAKIEGGALVRERCPVDPGALIPNIFATYAAAAAEAQLTLESHVPDVRPMVAGDPTCVSVLLDNLVMNAVRYNKPGGRVSVAVNAAPGEVIVSVSDTGIGIPAKYRQMLFDEFFRIEGEGAQKTSGTGLGLAICRRIVSELGGRIEVESEVGKGSTFRVRLPALEPLGVGNAV